LSQAESAGDVDYATKQKVRACPPHVVAADTL
jgi:hypothetical protein